MLKKILTLLLKILLISKGLKGSVFIYIPNFKNKRQVLIWKLKVLNPLLGRDINIKKKISSEIPIEIIIPVSIKDIVRLQQVVEGCKNFVRHPIQNIYVVGPSSSVISSTCVELGVKFIEEIEVLGYDKQSINYSVNGNDRSGWLFQQLLKLSGDQISRTENFLVVDADTIFVRNRVFLWRKKTIFDLSEERHDPYHIVYKRILEEETTSMLSFVTHYMLLNKKILKQLKSDIEEIHRKNWDAVIIEQADKNDESGFSEYELYGNYFRSRFPRQINNAYWFNSTTIANHRSGLVKSISFHNYI